MRNTYIHTYMHVSIAPTLTTSRKDRHEVDSDSEISHNAEEMELVKNLMKAF